jgi:hypothetical protein
MNPANEIALKQKEAMAARFLTLISSLYHSGCGISGSG